MISIEEQIHDRTYWFQTSYLEARDEEEGGHLRLLRAMQPVVNHMRTGIYRHHMILLTPQPQTEFAVNLCYQVYI